MTRTVKTLVLALASLGPGLPLGAQPQVIAVDVQFDIATPAIKDALPVADVPVVVEAVRQAILEDLSKRIPHWSFQASDGAATPDAELLFRLIEGMPGVDQTHLELRRKGKVVKDWRIDFFRPGDAIISGYPATADLAIPKFLSSLRELISQPRESEIADMLRQNVPIAVGGKWVAGVGPGKPPRIVLPVAWERFVHLNQSTLDVRCPADDATVVRLDSAFGGRALFTSDGGASFEALAVIPTQRTDLAGSVKVDPGQYPGLLQLRPRTVFVKNYVPPVLDDWDTVQQP